MSSSCCGRAVAAQCRCYTDADAIVDALRAFVGRRVRNPHDAEDVTQEALLRLYRGAPDLSDERALEGWMYRIARNAIVDHHRRAATRPAPVDTDARPEPAAEEPPEPRADESLTGCIATLLGRVPEHYRRALELTDLGGLTQERAAAELGLSTSGMKSRVQRGRRMLREEVTRCCEIALDVRGGLTDVEIRDGGPC